MQQSHTYHYDTNCPGITPLTSPVDFYLPLPACPMLAEGSQFITTHSGNMSNGKSATARINSILKWESPRERARTFSRFGENVLLYRDIFFGNSRRMKIFIRPLSANNSNNTNTMLQEAHTECIFSC